MTEAVASAPTAESSRTGSDAADRVGDDVCRSVSPSGGRVEDHGSTEANNERRTESPTASSRKGSSSSHPFDASGVSSDPGADTHGGVEPPVSEMPTGSGSTPVSVRLRSQESSASAEHRALKEYTVCAYAANSPIEDQYVADDDARLYAVFDGHGGRAVAEFAKKRLAGIFAEETNGRAEEMNADDIGRALQRVFLKIDDEFFAQYGREQPVVGSCALVVYRGGDFLVVANAGDSRAVLGRRAEGGEIESVALSTDHTLANDSEYALLRARSRDPNPGRSSASDHSMPVASRVQRVAGVLMVTRSLGDFCLKRPEMCLPGWNADFLPYITAEPEITVHRLSSSDEFLVLASDGVWDHLGNDEVVQYIERFTPSARHRDNESMSIVRQVLRRAAASEGIGTWMIRSLKPGQRRNYHDDITVLTVALSPYLREQRRAAATSAALRAASDAAASSSDRATPSTRKRRRKDTSPKRGAGDVRADNGGDDALRGGEVFASQAAQAEAPPADA